MLKCQILGNLGGDPELRYSAQGVPMLQFNVACNYRGRSADGDQEERTEWVRVRILGTRAEALQGYLSKGQKVYCDGRLEARPWVTTANELRSGLELLADTIEFASSANDGERPTAVPAARHPSQAPASQTQPPAGARGYARAQQTGRAGQPAPAPAAQRVRQATLDPDLDDVPF